MSTSNTVSIEEFFDQFIGMKVIFEAVNGYGISAKGSTNLLGGQQLSNNRKHADTFRIDQVHQGVYKFISFSVPGQCVGIDITKVYSHKKARGYKSILVKESDGEALFRVVPARNDSDYFVSFESVIRPGYLLTHCDGLVWCFDKPANEEEKFALDCSWKVIPV